MPFTIPDKGEGDNDIQSILFQEDLEILAAGVSGLDCVLSGFAITGGADMTPAVAKGAVLSNGVLFAVAAADVTITAADATNPRLDLVVVTSAGAFAVRAGTPAAAPKPPTRTANDVVLWMVYVPANDTAIATSQCIDKRVFRTKGPIEIYKTTTAETTNTTAAAVNILDKANAGVVIPNGLFLSGRVLRVRIGGNILFNSGTPTLTLTVIYGGTTMFADASVASVADADRRAWMLDLMIVAQGNADQALFGSLFLQPLDILVAAAATTGIGDLATASTSNRLGTVPFAGSAAVDSDAANRT
ncbi:MAG: hypothetical protein ACREKH_21920, partial [Candidatus Rokuibacteriota bacterium]